MKHRANGKIQRVMTMYAIIMMKQYSKKFPLTIISLLNENAPSTQLSGFKFVKNPATDILLQSGQCPVTSRQLFSSRLI